MVRDLLLGAANVELSNKPGSPPLVLMESTPEKKSLLLLLADEKGVPGLKDECIKFDNVIISCLSGICKNVSMVYSCNYTSKLDDLYLVRLQHLLLGEIKLALTVREKKFVAFAEKKPAFYCNS